MTTLRMGIIGTGSVVREIYQYLYFKSDYAPLISVDAICDLNAGHMDDFGDRFGIPRSRRFQDYRKMLSDVALDAVAINTPDSFHRDPVMAAMDAGLDVLLPKPLADKVVDADAMIQRMESTGRFLGVDFHKREDPRLKEAQTRFRNGDYGSFQTAVWYMLDKLMVADPNHTPRFFATPDFAVKNTPVSFLTVHMADAFMFITGLKPVQAQATGYKQKLPSLTPLPLDGYDLVNTELLFENGGVCHIITGWAVPNTAHAATVQSARIIGSEGLLDLNLDAPGYHEILPDGIFERNPLFRNFERDGSVSGYGVRSPGRIVQDILRFRRHEIQEERLASLRTPFSLGFYTTLVCEAAHESLARGDAAAPGVTRGQPINLKQLLEKRLGGEAAARYF